MERSAISARRAAAGADHGGPGGVDGHAQRDKLACLGQLAAGIAHELNNPIGYIGSNLGSLERYATALVALVEHADGLIGADQRPAWQARLAAERWAFIRRDLPGLIAETRHGAAHLTDLVAALKNVARAGPAAETISVDACVRSGLAVLAHHLRQGGAVDVDLRADAPLRAVRAQLIQLTINLVHNALQAVQTLPATARRDLRIATRPDDHGVTLTVEDSGPGVAVADRERIFAPYVTTRPDGTGLGLALVADIAAAHRGRVWCDVSPDLGGARFTVELAGLAE